MKAMQIRVGYGMNNAYLGGNWVLENALDAYKKEWEEKIRAWGYKKEIHFLETCYQRTELDEKGNGEILAYTLNGLKTVRIK